MRLSSIKDIFFFKRIGVIVLIYLQSQFLAAQQSSDLKFRRYGLEDGLSQVTSKCLIEDQNGYIWIGTQDGLNRFNGYTFKVFRNNPEDVKSISSNFIHSLYQNSDGKILVGTDAGLNIFNPSDESFVALRHGTEPNSLSHNNVFSILEDRNKRLWVGTENGLNLQDHKTSTFIRYSHDPVSNKSISNNTITSLCEDREGNIWIGTANGLNRYDPKNDTFRSFHHDPSDTYSLSSNEVSTIYEDRLGYIWVGTLSGLCRFDPDTDKFLTYRHNPYDSQAISGNHVLSIFQDSKDHLWVGTSQGLNLFDAEEDNFTQYLYNPEDPYSLSNNTIWSLLEDQSNNLWIGVSNKGLNFHDPKSRNFIHYRYKPASSISLLDNAVRSVLSDREGQLWVGSYTGVTVIDRKTNQSRQYQHDPQDPHSLSNNYVISIYQDKQNQVWLGTSNGLNLYNPEEDNFSTYKGGDGSPLTDVGISFIVQDHEQNMWFGTDKNGIYRVNLKKGTVKSFRSSNKNGLSHDQISCIFQDSQNRIWVGSAFGLNLYNSTNETFTRFNHEDGNSRSISHDNITSIAEDLQGRIWVATNSGFNFLDTETSTFKPYHVEDGLSNDVVYGILVDNKGFIWLSTNNGINKFDPEMETFIHYDKEDGLQSNEFNSRAYHRDNNGLLYFGGVNGLSIFHPDSIQNNTHLPSVVLTDFLLFNKSVAIGDSSVLSKSLDHTEEIVLQYDHDMFAFEFSALSYKQPTKNQFAFRLLPFSKEWIYTDYTDRKAVFTRIPPGTYSFQVKASNDDGYWNEEAKTIQVRILPPWWLTWWAILFYVIFALTTAVLIIRFQWNRIELKNRLKQEKREAEQSKVLDKMKTDFFSNITHEFRTPLTLMIGPAQQILKQPQLDESFTRTQVEMIVRNSQKFLLLINQLLDLSKLEGKGMSLDFYRGDLTEFIKQIVSHFESAALQKKIRLAFSSQIPVIDYLFDRDKLDKIFYNLLSNALKFTPISGEVLIDIKVNESSDGVNIIVKDNGIGIPEGQLHQVFNRFHQVDGSSKRKHEGTGIGLALTKELIEVHGGTITVASELKKGTIFTIDLPLEIATGKSEATAEKSPLDDESGLSDYSIPDDSSSSVVDAIGIDTESDQPIVLIIEDNNDLRIFIESIMKEKYQTVTARDGIEGIELALKYLPDLIISDVMMPDKDGFEVTQTLKANPLSSHIPIILLTAKSTLKSRVEGLQQGADAYLTKPFSVEELSLIANRQIDTTKILRVKYSISDDNQTDDSIGYKKIDQAFIDQLHSFIETNLSNEELSVDELTTEAGMSHSQLYRKIKALTDMSIASFIRNYRLTRALELLNDGSYNVTEVANMTGFGNRRYFHKVFVDKYSYPPSEVLKTKK